MRIPVEAKQSRTTIGEPVKRGLFPRIRGFLFGFDLFISYPRADATRYARRLANHLTEQGYICYLDQYDTIAAREVPDKVKRALRRSNRLVLVGTEGAKRSSSMRQEIEIFLETSRHIVPINVAGSLVNEDWFKLIPGLPQIDESTEAAELGEPSPDVLMGVNDAAKFTKRTRRLTRIFWGLLAASVLLSGVSVYASIHAVQSADKVRAAEAERKEAENGAAEQLKRATEFASKADQEEKRADTEKERADTEKNRANGEQNRADQQHDRANVEQKRADQQQDRADDEQARADQEYNRANQEGRRADALNLATYAKSTIPFDPSLSTLLASEALKMTEIPTEEALEAMRRSLEASYLDFTMPVSDHAVLAALSPSGDRLVTASRSEGQIWDVKAGSQLPIARLRGHRSQIRSVSFSPDQQLVVTSSLDKTAGIWNAATGQLVKNLVGHIDFVDSADFSRDGDRIFTVSLREGKALIWERRGPDWVTAEVTKEINLRQPGDGTLGAVAFSPNGASLVTADSEGNMRVWNVTKASIEAVCRSDSGAIAGLVPGVQHSQVFAPLVFSPNGEVFAASYNTGFARIWETQNCKPSATLKPIAGPLAQIFVSAFAFSPDGARLATAEWGGKAHVWEVRTGKQLTEMNAHQSRAIWTEFSHDGSLVLTAGADNTARVWVARTGELVDDFRGHMLPVTWATFRPKDDTVVTAGDDGTARVWRVRAETLRNVIKLHGAPQSSSSEPSGPTPVEPLWYPSFSADGGLIVTLREFGGYETKEKYSVASVWNVATGAFVSELRGHRGRIRSAVFDRASETIVTSAEDGTVRWWRARDGKNVQTTEGLLADDISYAAPSPNGRHVATYGAGFVRVWDKETDSLLAIWRTDTPRRLEFSRDGNLILIAVGDSAFLAEWRKYPVGGSLRSLDDGAAIRLGPHAAAVRVAAFSPDDKNVVTASWDGTARVWETATGRRIASLRGHSSALNAAAFSSNGALVATGDNKGSIRVWETGTGRLVKIISGPGFSLFNSYGGLELNSVLSVAFDPKTQDVVSIRSDGTRQQITCDLCGAAANLLALAEKRSRRKLTPEEQRDYIKRLSR